MPSGKFVDPTFRRARGKRKIVSAHPPHRLQRAGSGNDAALLHSSPGSARSTIELREAQTRARQPFLRRRQDEPGDPSVLQPYRGPRSAIRHQPRRLVNDMQAVMAELSSVLKIAPRPSTRPYAEFRFRDLEGNALDLSQTKGWEVDIGKWETAT